LHSNQIIVFVSLKEEEEKDDDVDRIYTNE
jgi:hypothetical protein